ncbi:hypothetical protein M9H77_30127 [Catharanthus roseus]|uniref:Uncharacterized protein n=1 Tax=Catharanthus roseus TaxID=4058 RepID=A0ACB9ZY85_CATRO|nr:hypothetical protein M9H77_30127 [Catharanthus roseus]
MNIYKKKEFILEILQVLLHLKNKGRNSCGFRRSRRMFTSKVSVVETRDEGEAILVVSMRRECSLRSHTARACASHILVDHIDPQCLSEVFESHGIQGLSEDII